MGMVDAQLLFLGSSGVYVSILGREGEKGEKIDKECLGTSLSCLLGKSTFWWREYSS